MHRYQLPALGTKVAIALGVSCGVVLLGCLPSPGPSPQAPFPPQAPSPTSGTCEAVSDLATAVAVYTRPSEGSPDIHIAMPPQANISVAMPPFPPVSGPSPEGDRVTVETAAHAYHIPPTAFPGGGAPTPEPVLEEPTPEPVLEEPTPEPVLEEPTPEPVLEEPTPEPVLEEPTPEPVLEEPTPEPVP